LDKIWFITGSSRGLGRALVEKVLAAGHGVAATARNPGGLADLAERYGDRVRAIALDVTDRQAAEAAVAETLQAFGRIDVLVNNAGYGDLSSVEDMPEKAFRDQIETNLMGVFHLTRAVLPSMRARGHGYIMQVTSIGARLGIPGLSGYHAAKWAVEGLSESLAKEVGPLGIRVSIIEPGGMRTDWAGNSMTVHPYGPDYRKTVGSTVDATRAMSGTQISDPDRCAAVMLGLAEVKEPPLRLLLGNDAISYAAETDAMRLRSDRRWRALGSIVGYEDEELSADAVKSNIETALTSTAPG
jgi:NAD(P)-dependent dehydrogenase (short-subunit alcohol dehydrogenase family)